MARSDFRERMREIRRILRLLAKATGDATETSELLARLGGCALWASPVALEAVFGCVQARLLQQAQRNARDRASGRTVSEKDLEADGFVPSTNPGEAARLLNAHVGILARTKLQRLELSRRIAPIGSLWRRGYSGPQCEVVKHTANGWPLVKWPEGKQIEYALYDFTTTEQKDRRFRRADPTDDELKAIPIGSRWYKGSRLFRVVRHQRDYFGIVVSPPPNGCSDWSPNSFLGPGAEFRPFVDKKNS